MSCYVTKPIWNTFSCPSLIITEVCGSHWYIVLDHIVEFMQLVPTEVTPEVAATISTASSGCSVWVWLIICILQVTSGPVAMSMLPGNNEDANKADVEACLKLNLEAQVSNEL